MAKAICSVESCDNPTLAKGVCNLHYKRLQKYGATDLPGRRGCGVRGCAGAHKGHGYCAKHYQRFVKYGVPDLLPDKRICLGPECDRLVSAHQGFGLCRSHYAQINRGVPLKPLVIAPQNLGRPAVCVYEDCDRPHKARGYCKAHNELLKKGEPLRSIQERLPAGPCAIRGCESLRAAKGLCQRHWSSFYGRWKLYGISRDDGIAMWKSQGMACAVCRSAAEIHELHIDHDHTCCPRVDRKNVACGDCFRGLLCGRCNLGIGQLQDDPQRLRVAADYLEAATSR